MSTSTDDAAASTALRFQSLHVDRFNGLTHELSLELCDGVTVIYGSNASGKTTLAEAVRALLWPGQFDDQRSLAEGTFSFDGADWRVRLEGQSCTYLRDKAPTSPPSLPPPTHSRRYHLYLHDLLHGADEQDFARLIVQEAQGGIDVEGAAAALNFEITTRHTSNATRAVEEAQSALQEARTAQEALREDEARLDELSAQRAEAQAAARRETALDQAIEVARARTEHEEAEAALNAFPDVLAEVRGDEAERLASLQDQIAAAERALAEAREQKREAQATVDDSRIPAAGLPDGRLEEVRSATTTLQEQERRVRELRADVAAAEDAADAAWTRLAAGVDRKTAADIDLPQVQVVEKHAQAVESLQGRRKALATAEALFAEAAPEESVDVLRDGLRQLHRWLQVPASEASARRGPWGWAVLSGGILVTAAGGLVGGLSEGVTMWVGWGLVGLGGLIILAELWRTPGRGESAGNQRSVHEQEFERLGVEAPEAWTPGDVEQRSDELLARLREASVAAAKQEEWRRLQPQQQEVETKAAQLETERARLAEEMGLTPEVSSRSLFWLLDHLGRWQTTHDDRASAEAAREAARAQAAECRDRLNDLLKPYDLASVADGDAAQGAVEALQSAQEAFRDAQRTLDRAQDALDTAQEKRRDAEAQRADVYDRLGLEEGEEAALRALVERHDAYETAVEDERTAQVALETEQHQLRRCEAYEAWMMEAAEEDLRRARAEAASEAAEEETYLDAMKDIEHRIQAAREGGTLEQRQAEYRRARTQLAQDRDRDYDRAVGHVLAELVQKETRDRGLPPVFHRARELFAEITNDRYELHLDRSDATFRAYDHVYDRSFSLNALSSGTKVQLLLSVRVAFVETQEQGCRAPLVLDETLANSDAERARAIIDAVRTLCREGRQVLYLTAQADEVEKWQAGLAEAAVEHRVCSLTDLDQRESAGNDGAADVPIRRSPPSLPAPAETSHAALRETLDVPDWHPRRPVSRVHLWYLVEAVRLLLTLVKAGTRTWGQLRFQHQRGGISAVPLSDASFARVQALAHAVTSWKEAWQVGRGRPVDRPALEQTDAVTDTFIDGVSALANELEGDAEALLGAVRERTDERVSGFRSAKADDLEAYLREEGYLDPRDRRTPAEMWQYVLADVATAREEGHLQLDDLERLFQRLQGETPTRVDTD